MKIIMYGTGKAEREYVQDWMKETGNEVEMVSDQLNVQTIDLAKGCDGISIQQTKPLGDSAVYQELAAMGIKQIATRTAGYDMIDLAA